MKNLSLYISLYVINVFRIAKTKVSDEVTLNVLLIYNDKPCVLKHYVQTWFITIPKHDLLQITNTNPSGCSKWTCFYSCFIQIYLYLNINPIFTLTADYQYVGCDGTLCSLYWYLNTDFNTINHAALKIYFV